MKNQPYVYGIIGLVIGVLMTGFLMSFKQTPVSSQTMITSSKHTGSSMSMEDMMTGLRGKNGDEFD